ncbi:MAG: OmpA family protein, partial [Kangiellaceae bacterium]|nr:OmpA family protein [Kangiellaceae bacterium]
NTADDVTAGELVVGRDTDGDGILDHIDLDDDNDGIPDTVENATATNGGDTDGDGIPDSLDLDSDGDGILDIVESGNGASDTDGDGQVDGDVGSNGLLDDLETTPDSGTPNSTPTDTDGDGLPDFQELDADGDSVPDSTEGHDADMDGQPDVVPTGTDTDGDGIDDAYDPDNGGTTAATQDTDGDGTADYQDVDDDNDGTNTINEDANGDGDPTNDDSDGDGTPDYLDPDAAEKPLLRVIKTAAVSQVQIGDFIRYTVTVENIGTVDATDVQLVDTPPLGFSYVDNSGVITDANPDNNSINPYRPLLIEGVDVAVGQTATVEYMMRIGATAVRGEHINRVVAMFGDDIVSNEASVSVFMSADPDFEQATIMGKVFNDRDGDGWQDDATATGIVVTGGIDESTYIANSTTVDRGQGPQPEADASAPINHGINLGKLEGRNSVMDAATNHQMVISQMMSEPRFTNDFVLTTAQGTRISMNADGQTQVTHSGEMADGLTTQDIRVERAISQIGDNYRVDYIITNNGIYERGIPGVRLATVEGLIIETDAYGRFHLNAIDVDNYGRGKNFIMKVDAATLPAGSEFTTENPRVKRLTQGLSSSFDFGVKIPEPQEQETVITPVEIEMGTVFFDDNSAQINPEYQQLIQQIADKVNHSKGGDITISGHGGGLGIAFDRAYQLRDALLPLVDADVKDNLNLVLQGFAAKVEDGREILTIGRKVKLGEFFFDTNKATVKPEFSALVKSIAEYFNQKGGGAISVVGHTDQRADNDYNYKLGLKRADSVYQAILQHLDKNLIKNVKIEVTPQEFKTVTGGDHE